MLSQVSNQAITTLPVLSLTLEQLPVPILRSDVVCTVPLFLCAIPAGFPSPATDHLEGELDITKYLVRHKAATFVFRVQGYSMRDAGIIDGDKAVVDKSVTPQHGHIVIAVIDGEYTIKRLHNQDGRIELRAENPAFKPICFNEFSMLEIWGVVVGVVRRYA